MDALKRTLVEKAGHDFGFEYTVSETPKSIILGSARHPLHVEVTLTNGQYRLLFGNAKQQLLNELKRDFPVQNREIVINAVQSIAQLFKRAAALAHALPNQAENDFETALSAELNKLPDNIKNTEVERMVRQRIGQDTYRKAMLEYWGGACAVTGVSMPEVLRASHALPWAECATDAQRLDVFNGFLFIANLDALFDRFLGLDKSYKLRWITQDHERYLKQHRQRLVNKNA